MNSDGWKGREALSGERLDAAFADIVKPMTADLSLIEVGDWVNVEHYRAGELVARHQAVVTKTWVNADGNPVLQFRDPIPSDPRPAEVSITVIGTIR